MTVKTRQENTHAIYFVTFTCFKWLNLFSITHIYDSIYKWFRHLESKEVFVTGYVIMPNHIHLLLYFSANSPELMKVIANGKRFLAYEIVKRLEKKEEYKLLEVMQKVVKPSDRRNKKLHEVFRPSYDSKECITEKFIKQKLDYIHKNPVSKKWNLVENYLDYQHSSARFYELNEEHPEFKLKSFGEFL